MQNEKEIKDHYDNLKSISIKNRKHSQIINIRIMNNFIKSLLIHKYSVNNATILDLGCGRGGDMKKHFVNKPKLYFGIDISDKSIEEARARYDATLHKKAKYNEIEELTNNVCFEVKDAYNKTFDLEMKFDVISCQFSLHYAFASKEVFETSIKNITNHLADGGLFYATIPNKEVIMRRYKKYGNGFGNEYYKINFKQEYHDIVEKDTKFGIEYFFELKEAIDNCVEYLVDYKVLVDAFRKHNYEFVEFKDFVSFFNKNYKQHEELFLMQMKKRLNEEELKVVELYSVIVFKKIRN